VLAYYHLVLYHSSLRERLPEPIPTRGDGSPKVWRQQTPVMSAGLLMYQTGDSERNNLPTLLALDRQIQS